MPISSIAAFLVGVGFAVLPLVLSLFAFAVTAAAPPHAECGAPPLRITPPYTRDLSALLRSGQPALPKQAPALYFWLVLSGGLGAALTAMLVTRRWVA